MPKKYFNVGIVGYRKYDDYKDMKKKVTNILKKTMIDEDQFVRIVSGGCEGTDKLAERYAKDKKLEIKIYLPNWDKYGKAAGNIRNLKIVKKSDILIAFLSSKSIGTKNTIGFFKKKENFKNKNLHIIKI